MEVEDGRCWHGCKSEDATVLEVGAQRNVGVLLQGIATSGAESMEPLSVQFCSVCCSERHQLHSDRLRASAGLLSETFLQLGRQPDHLYVPILLGAGSRNELFFSSPTFTSTRSFSLTLTILALLFAPLWWTPSQLNYLSHVRCPPARRMPPWLKMGISP
jgi:hypothetical protein